MTSTPPLVDSPAGSPTLPPLLRCVVLAEFDIDRGSCVRVQYPCNLSEIASHQHVAADKSDAEQANKDMMAFLAEQMLPDGLEKHSASHTVTMFNRPDPDEIQFGEQSQIFEGKLFEEHKIKIEVKGDAAAAASGSQDGSEPSSPQPQFQEKKVWRPHVAPAGFPSSHTPQCVVVKGSQLIVYNGLKVVLQTPLCEAQLVLVPEPPEGVRLEKGDENYHPKDGGSGSPPQFGMMDTSGGEIVGILFSDLATAVKLHEIVEAHTTPSKEPSRGPTPKPVKPNNFLFGVSCAVTKKDSSVRRGGINKALLIVGSNFSSLQALNPIVIDVLEQCCLVKGNDETAIVKQRDLLKAFFDGVKRSVIVHPDAVGQGMSLPLRNIYARIIGDDSKTLHRCGIDFRDKTTTVKFPLLRPLLEMTLEYFPFEMMLTTVKNVEDLGILLSAVFFRKRVIIMSQGYPPGAVSDAAMALGLMFYASLPSVLLTRTFPYSSIGTVDDQLKVPGCIIGSANPLFESRTDWWDVLWNLDAGTIVTTPDYEGPKLSPTPADCTFFNSLLAWLEQKRLAFAHAPDVERGIRLKLVDYVEMICESSLVREVSRAPDIAAVFQTPNASRCALLVRTSLGAEWLANKTVLGMVGTSSSPSIASIAALVRHTDVSEEIVLLQRLQLILRYVQTQQQIVELLSYFPEALGGVTIFGTLLFHPSKAVQLLAVAVLRLLDSFPVGKQVVSGMNTFTMLAYEESKKSQPATEAAYAAQQ